MTTSEPPTPRRALPSQDDTTTPAPVGRHRPSRAIWTESESEASTPVPPPAPVLPDTSVPGRLGRRFSAESANEATYVPRRSAASVSSPPRPEGAPDMLDNAPTRIQPKVAAARAAQRAAVDEQPAGRRTFWADRRQRLITLGIAGAAVLALVAGLFIAAQWGRIPATGSPVASASSTPSGTAASTAAPTTLLDAPDLASLAQGVTWTVGETLASAAPDAVRPLCLPASNDPVLTPASRQQRSLTGTGDASLLQVQDVFATADAATKAYTALAEQLGGCDAAGALITRGYAVSGLADQAAAMNVAVQDPDGQQHTLLLARTGTTISIVDAAQSKTAFNAGNLAKALGASLQRLCDSVAGTCPGTIKSVQAPPPVSGQPGWLVEADLPRVSAGAGRWGATSPASPNLVGSQCESIDHNTMPGSTQRSHRTYLLADDKAAPSGFGVDEALYTFGKAADATAAAKKISTAMAGCRERTRTATVTTLDPVKTVGANGKDLTGSAYSVSQRISATKSVAFRVAVGVSGKRLVYLLANPSTSFDFTDAEWGALAARALERASQGS